MFEAILTSYEGRRDGAKKLPEAIAWADVIVFGPGMGRGKATRTFLHILKECAKVTVIMDADGLNEISEMEKEGENYLSDFPVPMILTPHFLEMSRLSGYTVAQLKEDRIPLAREYAKKKGVTLVLKDSRTIVTEGKKDLYINQTGNSGMATGGSGDVLAGMIAGVVAAGMAPMEAAAMGVFLHGRGGDEGAKALGQRCLLAGDLIGFMTDVLGGQKDGKRPKL